MKIEFCGNTFHTPDTWNQVADKKLFLAYYILKFSEANIMIRKIEVAKMLMDVGDDFFARWQQVVINEFGAIDGPDIFAKDMTLVVEAINAPFFERVTKDENTYTQIALTRTKCPFPELKMLGKNGQIYNLYAAKDGFENITIGEFAAIDFCVQKYLDTQEESHVYQALAYIYRRSKEKSPKNKREKWQGDRRIPLDIAKHDEAAHIAAFKTHLDHKSVKVLWFWIVSCREVFLRKYKRVFQSSQIAKSDLEKQLQSFGWVGVFIEMANKSGVLTPAIERQNAHEFLIQLQYAETKRLCEEAAATQNKA
jgi:hypothetical protein